MGTPAMLLAVAYTRSSTTPWDCSLICLISTASSSTTAAIPATVTAAAITATVTAAAITAAFGLAAKFTKSAIEAAIADDAEQQKLIATLKARGQTTEQATKRVNELIAAGQKLAFTDSETRKGYEIATSFAKKYANQQKILTTAQDLARAKNISLEAATKLVGRAFDGNTGALEDAGQL